MTLWWSRSIWMPRSSVRKALDQKPYWSWQEMPKAMEKANTAIGTAVKVTRVMRIKITRAKWPVFIAIRKGKRSGTDRVWNAVNLEFRRKALNTQPRPRMITLLSPELAEMTTIENCWLTDTGRNTAPSTECWYSHCASTFHICGDRRMFAWYTRFTNKDEWENGNFARRVAGKGVQQGNVRLKFRIPGNCERQVVVSDVLHVRGAHNALSQSRLMDQGLQIVPVNGFGIKIYDNANAGHRGQGSIGAAVPPDSRQFQFDVDAGGKGRQSRDVSRGRKWHISPKTILNKHSQMDILEPEKPKTQEILVPITWTPTFNQPQPAANHYSKGGNSRDGNAAGQMHDCTGSTDWNEAKDENEDDEDEDPPAVIDRAKKSSFTRDFAGLNRNLGTALEAPSGSNGSKSRTDHHCRRSGALEMKSAAAYCPVQATALDIGLQIRCDFRDGISSLVISWDHICFREALGMADYLGGTPGTAQFICLRSLQGLDLQLGYSPGGVLSGHWMPSSCGIGWVMSGGATVTLLLVYVSNRWIAKSMYASPSCQLQHKMTYAYLCTRIGSTDMVSAVKRAPKWMDSGLLWKRQISWLGVLLARGFCLHRWELPQWHSTKVGNGSRSSRWVWIRVTTKLLAH